MRLQRLAGTSEMVSGTSSAAHTAHTPRRSGSGAQRAISGRVEHPGGCGGTRNAANRNDPTATTAAISPAARTNGSP